MKTETYRGGPFTATAARPWIEHVTSGHRRYLLLVGVLALLAALVLAASRWAPSLSIANPLGETGRAASQPELAGGLNRLGVRPEGAFPTVDVLLITREILASADDRDLVGTAGEPSVFFFVYEESHIDLPIAPARPLLRLVGTGVDATGQPPAEARLLSDSPHHRALVFRYSVTGPLGHLQHGMGERLELIFPSATGREDVGNVLSWELPLRYGPRAQSANPVLSGSGSAIETPSVALGPSVSVALALGLFGGFLTSMWPCLFQLTAYFIPSLAGISMAQAGRPTRVMRRRIVVTALYFVAGIVVVYTATGALIGYLAGTLGGADLLASYRRPLSVVAGVLIIGMALRMAARARAPLVCHMPIVSLSGRGESGSVGTMVLGLAFATGCMTCFGAALGLGMLTYAATAGSALMGAALLFLFSLGIAVPLVVAAVAMARVLPLLGRLEVIAPRMALASSAVMIGFALLLITDNYHVVTGVLLGGGLPLPAI
ncbi:MAG: sulfite exporter TauE/SafE family protein [Chloroflexi bacterium]|nr:sulfite exporter TauE/SafE family protein [Chloroflexota bacterium]